jgi:hypothetical protein
MDGQEGSGPNDGRLHWKLTVGQRRHHECSTTVKENSDGYTHFGGGEAGGGKSQCSATNKVTASVLCLLDDPMRLESNNIRGQVLDLFHRGEEGNEEQAAESVGKACGNSPATPTYKKYLTLDKAKSGTETTSGTDDLPRQGACLPRTFSSYVSSHLSSLLGKVKDPNSHGSAKFTATCTCPSGQSYSVTHYVSTFSSGYSGYATLDMWDACQFGTVTNLKKVRNTEWTQKSCNKANVPQITCAQGKDAYQLYKDKVQCSAPGVDYHPSIYGAVNRELQDNLATGLTNFDLYDFAARMAYQLWLGNRPGGWAYESRDPGNGFQARPGGKGTQMSLWRADTLVGETLDKLLAAAGKSTTFFNANFLSTSPFTGTDALGVCESGSPDDEIYYGDSCIEIRVPAGANVVGGFTAIGLGGGPESEFLLTPGNEFKVVSLTPRPIHRNQWQNAYNVVLELISWETADDDINLLPGTHEVMVKGFRHKEHSQKLNMEVISTAGDMRELHEHDEADALEVDPFWTDYHSGSSNEERDQKIAFECEADGLVWSTKDWKVKPWTFWKEVRGKCVSPHSR